MSAINKLVYAAPSALPPVKRVDAADKGAENNSASQPPQTDSYDAAKDKKYILPIPKGAYKNGDAWVMPPDTLKRTDRRADKIISKEEITISAKSAAAGSGGAGASDAQFKGVLTREAVEYSALEKNIHTLLGFTLETFKTTVEAEGELSAWASLADGTFFNSAFSGYAASYSIFNKYTFDDAFRAQYNTSPSMAVEYGFESLRAMMESVVIKQTEDGNVNTSAGK